MTTMHLSGEEFEQLLADPTPLPEGAFYVVSGTPAAGDDAGAEHLRAGAALAQPHEFPVPRSRVSTKEGQTPAPRARRHALISRAAANATSH